MACKEFCNKWGERGLIPDPSCVREEEEDCVSQRLRRRLPIPWALAAVPTPNLDDTAS